MTIKDKTEGAVQAVQTEYIICCTMLVNGDANEASHMLMMLKMLMMQKML